MSDKPKIAVFTYIPSPYQVELFNAVADKNTLSLSVFYVYSKLPPYFMKHSSIVEYWAKPPMRHDHVIFDGCKDKYFRAKSSIETADLAIFGYYTNPMLIKLMKQRINAGKKWCFWGERPGYNLGRFGVRCRRWILRGLYNSNAPIWGIGKWAIEGYKMEFGKTRKYFNIPYFSDLDRFNRIKDENRNDKTRIFLFSSSLVYRKGADLLAYAFNKLADEFPYVRLHIIGEGNLRRKLEKYLLKHKDKVQFLGFKPWKELPEYYRVSHVLCAPSRYDGWAVNVPEALASGLPVISTERTGAALEFVKNNENGWMIPAGNKEALYKAMREATLLPTDELLKHSYSARMSVLNHSLQNGSQRFQDAVREVLSS